MTVLYRLATDAAAIAARFGAAAGGDPWSGGTIAPGQFAPVITAGREAIAGPRAPGQPRRMVPRLWGVPPPPAAGDAGRGVLTVRNPDSPFWIGNLRNSEFRCLVPATAVMVWGRAHPATGKRPQLWLGCTDQPLFAMAGVWKDSEIPSFALLTCAANAAWREAGHAAMPVILPDNPAAWQLWLNGDWARAATLLAPYSSSRIAAGH
ncbi:SOS response-associated peptidase family protein [Novosphingobium aquiterrae]|uniref:SOS response-associated peptidase family protein n=1 Tax=Novosphingobium aquiterrae TaxID=624388 RepID=A0ABV6PIG4_9SPHN